MKKHHWLWYGVSVCMIAVALLLRDQLRILDSILVFSGTALFLATFWGHCIRKAQRCPNCGTVIYTGHIRTIAKQRDGLIPCEKCGTLVLVGPIQK